jgi:[protein-PII] uridylyltransferase
VAVDETTGTGAIVARLKDELAALDRAYSAGHHGLWSARRRSELVDVALREVFAATAPAGARIALAALGGYGRGVLVPGSDVDLLLIHDGSAAEDLSAVASSFLYPLWDAGVAIGHAVRTPEEAEAAAAERLDTMTATLDARLLAGDGDLFARATEGVLRRVREDPSSFAVRLGAAASERRERYGSAAHLLEPNLKDGGGGLRDVASLGWLERVLGRSLEEAGALGPGERASLAAAEEFLTRVRSALHLETGKRADRLVLDQQPAVARAMGFSDEPRLLAEDGLMRALFEHARSVEYLTEEILIERRRPGEGRVRAPSPPTDVESVLRLFVGSDGASRSPLPAELDAAKALELTDELSWTDETRDAFLAVLRSERGSRSLGTLDRLDILGRLIPEWRGVRCRPQRDPYHRSTVDVHLRSTLEGMRSALRDDARDDPVAREAAEQIADPDAALLGALLHDIGKNGEGAHVTAGVRLAGQALERMRLPARTRELAHFMVEHHLLLPDTATRRDLGDDELVLDVASKVGSPERLAALYLLSLADAEATGPAASTEWRRTLIRELVAKVQRVFERGDMGEELAERLTAGVNDVRERLVSERPEEVDRFVLRMPRGYFLTVEPSRAARHFPIVTPPLGSQDVRTASWEGVRTGTYELLVVAADRPGLLSWVAGCLTLEGLSILTAQAFTTDDGAAVDLFEVQGVFEPDVREDKWREFRGTLRKTIAGRVSLDHLVAEKRRHYREPARSIPVTVAIDNEASDFFTVIEIGAADRIGVLYDITRTLAELRLDVHLAKIATYADRVIDSFYVRDEVGRRITDREQTERIERALKDRLVEPSPEA